MLAAIALQRIGFGMVLIVIFSLGLAGVLTGIGILWVKARQLIGRFSGSNGNQESIVSTNGRRLLSALPVLSALFITIVGIALTVQALLDTTIFG
jgi:ABC-type nickel/cobalt efflux system permease component RcnA